MPITYATPDPFAPGISSAYGAAEQFSQDAPSIIGAASRAAEMQQAANQQANQLRFAYASANAEAQDRRAALYNHSQAANADREQSALNIGATLSQRNEEAMLDANTRMLQQRQGAELQAWMGQQDLNQKEAMRLQQMKAAVADVQASNLPPDQKQDLIMRLRTGIDPMEERLKNSQAKMAAAHAQLYQAQVDQDVIKTKKMAEINQMTASERIHYEVPVDEKAAIDAQIAGMGPLTPQERDRKFQEIARKSPRAQQFTIENDGNLKAINRHEQMIKPFFEAVPKADEIAQKEADRAHPPETDLNGKEKRSPENHRYAQQVLDRMRDEYESHYGIKQKAPSQPMDVNKTDFASQMNQLKMREDLPEEYRDKITKSADDAAAILKKVNGNLKDLNDEDKKTVAKAIIELNNVPPRVQDPNYANAGAAAMGSAMRLGLSGPKEDLPIAGPIFKSAPPIPVTAAQARAAKDILRKNLTSGPKQSLEYFLRQLQ